MMKTVKRLGAALWLVTLTFSVSMAQEAEAVEEAAPQGLGLLMVLIGLAAVLGVGLVLARRESGDASNLV